MKCYLNKVFSALVVVNGITPFVVVVGVIIFCLTSCASYYKPVINGQRIEVRRPHYKTEFQKWVLNMR